MYTSRKSETLCPLASEYADSVAAGTVNGVYSNMEEYHRAWLYINVGEMQTGATLDAGLQQAQDNVGTGVKAIAAKTITQLTQAGGDSDSIVCIELQTEELDVDGGFDFIRYYLTVGVDAVECAATLFGCESRFMPVSVANWTEVVG